MLKRFVIFKSPEPPGWRSLYPEHQRCRELSVKSLVTELKLICPKKEGRRNGELLRHGGRSSATPNKLPTIPKARRSSPLHFLSFTSRVRLCSHGAVSPCSWSNSARAPRHSEAATTNRGSTALGQGYCGEGGLTLLIPASDEDEVLGVASGPPWA
jgi:hypothetical protein